MNLPRTLAVCCSLLLALVGFATHHDSEAQSLPLAPLASASIAVEGTGKPQQFHVANDLAEEIPAGSLGLYVFDDHGNCVASQDQGDLSVRWTGKDKEKHYVEIRNLGAGLQLAAFGVR